MTKFYSGIAGRRSGKAKGAVIHNDGGSQNANANFYRNWLPRHEAENGFAQVYIGSDGRYQAESYDNCAWHTANSEGNTWYVGWEVCQSLGDEATFLANEQAVFKDVANWMMSEGLTPTRNTVRLHHEFSSTSCPHRSMSLHGNTTNAVKDYYIANILKYLNPVKNGWEKSGNQWYYYDNGVLVKNGWRNINGKWYLFDATSKMLTGWQLKDGKWYYFLENGAMHTGWSMIKGKWYCFDKDGAMVEGWRKSGEKWYYFDADGSMKQGWFKDKSNKWYYLSVPDGEMVTGTKSINGKAYIFDKNGVCTNP